MGKLDLFKAKGKGLMQGVMSNGKPIVLATAGVVGAQKFLDFKTLFPNVDPNKFFIKHEGAIKLGGVIVTLSMWKNCPEWLKWVLIGVAIQGGIKATRQYTMNAEGTSFVNQIGAGQYDAEIAAAAKEIVNAANEFPTGVAGTSTGLENNPGVNLIQNSQTSVAGMGMDEMNGLNDFNY